MKENAFNATPNQELHQSISVILDQEHLRKLHLISFTGFMLSVSACDTSNIFIIACLVPVYRLPTKKHTIRCPLFKNFPVILHRAHMQNSPQCLPSHCKKDARALYEKFNLVYFMYKCEIRITIHNEKTISGDANTARWLH